MERFTEELQAPYVTSGLAQYGCDYYAVLGVPLAAPQEPIRQGYLKAARLLHPDRYVGDERLKQEAGRLFSLLVTPAYDVLNRPSRRQEYDLMLKLLGSRLDPAALPAHALLASLRQCTSQAALENAYRAAVNQQAERLYRDFDQSLPVVNELSILNLGYLLLAQKLSNQPTVAAPTPAAEAPAEVQAAAPVNNWADRHFERGVDLLRRKQYREAIQSFRESLRLAPGNADAHAHLGIAFLRQGLPGMAKAEFQKALSIDPQQEVALKHMRAGEPAPVPQPKGKQVSPQKPKNLFDRLWRQLNRPM